MARVGRAKGLATYAPLYCSRLKGMCFGGQCHPVKVTAYYDAALSISSGPCDTHYPGYGAELDDVFSLTEF